MCGTTYVLLQMHPPLPKQLKHVEVVALEARKVGQKKKQPRKCVI